MKRKTYPDPKITSELLSYNSDTGKLYWKFRNSGPENWNSQFSGKEAMYSIEPTGYLRGSLLGGQYKSHLICWGIYYGSYPDKEIDHIDGNKANNAISNLRESSRSENQINIPIRKSNTSGYKGVSWKGRNGKWQSQIQINGTTKYLGLFSDKEDAYHAYCTASRLHHGEFGRV